MAKETLAQRNRRVKKEYRKKVGPPPQSAKRDGAVYAQGVFGMRGDATISRIDDNQAFLDHGPGNFPFDFPAVMRLRQMVKDNVRLGKVPRGWVLEIDFHGTVFAVRNVMDEPYKIYYKYSDDDGWTKLGEVPRKGTN